MNANQAKHTKQQDSGASAVGHKNIVSAVATAIYDRFSNRGQLAPLDPNLRLDGKVCLITGANSGLGKAVAIELASKGAHVIMACRGGHPDAGLEVQAASGNHQIKMMRVDLSDLNSVSTFCDELLDYLLQNNLKLDIAILNAGLMPLNARQSPQGYELMFAVHFLANRLMLQRWLEDGLLHAADAPTPSRVVFVASEAHQSSQPINFDEFGKFVHYGMKDGMKHYAMSKLHLCTYVHELSRRVNKPGKINLVVHALCPGPIASNIARESPTYIRPILSPIMKLLFRSPARAAEPVVLLACDPAMGRRTDVYLHMMREKHTSRQASDPGNGELLWLKSQAIIAPFLTRTKPAHNVEDSQTCQHTP